MLLSKVGEPIFNSIDIIQEIYKGNLSKISAAQINYATDIDYLSYVEFVQDNNLEDWPVPEPYFGEARTQEAFDTCMQNKWYMPDEYKTLDIESFLISLCQTDKERERINVELKLFKENNLIPLLRFLKFLVDHMREHNILWGVGRGSSVSSYSLFLLGIHKIDSLKYDLDIREFLR